MNHIKSYDILIYCLLAKTQNNENCIKMIDFRTEYLLLRLQFVG